MSGSNCNICKASKTDQHISRRVTKVPTKQDDSFSCYQLLMRCNFCLVCLLIRLSKNVGTFIPHGASNRQEGRHWQVTSEHKYLDVLVMVSVVVVLLVCLFAIHSFLQRAQTTLLHSSLNRQAPLHHRVVCCFFTFLFFFICRSFPSTAATYYCHLYGVSVVVQTIATAITSPLPSHCATTHVKNEM